MHNYNLRDDNQYFYIDPITRMIACGATNQRSVMQFDHNSEKNTFLLPRVIEGHDMLECNSVCVHYSNISFNKRDRIDDIYEIVDLAVCAEDDSYLTCTWIMDANSTKFAGLTEFVITFSCIENDEVEYVWSAVSNPGIYILHGKNNTKSISDTHADIISSLVARSLFMQNSITEMSAKIAELESKIRELEG